MKLAIATLRIDAPPDTGVFKSSKSPFGCFLTQCLF
jgi:hypothetical protein